MLALIGLVYDPLHVLIFVYVLLLLIFYFSIYNISTVAGDIIRCTFNF
jgi:hypothetical protein